MIKEVYEHLDYPQEPVRKVCREFLKVLGDHLGQGEEIYLDNLGVFVAKKRTVSKKFPDGKKRTRTYYKFRSHIHLCHKLLASTGEIKPDVVCSPEE
jgi:nucleoid DNA-binding protein